MPAPKIEQPGGGDTIIIVRSSVPGATIRIRAGSAEIGDGAGSLIALSRALISGEPLVVSQQLGTCNAGQAYTINVL